MNDLALPGCRTEPLGSYLKALGVLRLVAEQKDPGAKGWWRGDVFRLRTSLDREGLESFFIDEYRPTPLLAPWNSGSGFRTRGKRPEAERSLGLIEGSLSPRLEPYRKAIEAGREVVRDAEARGWRGKGKEFWDKKSKHLVVESCRATFPDEAIRWIDASVVLAEEPAWRVPLLGTGGNLGNQELSISFMQRLADALALHPSRGRRKAADPKAWLADALLEDGRARAIEAPVGQFDPGAAGGANSSPLGGAASLVNPWDYVLMLEGVLLFGSAAARRLAAGARGSVAIPFTFRASAVGFGSAADPETERASEVWTPIWTQPSLLGEISHLIGEGRGEWGGRQAATGLDMAKAAASLGVDRGVAAFGRNLIAQRFGQSMLATPIGRVDVRARSEVPILAAVDRWVKRVGRGENPPATLAAARRRLDAAMFDVSVRGGALPLQRVLIAAAEAEEAVAQAGSFRARNAATGPVRGLPAGEWLPLLDDGSPELRLAAALASQHDKDGCCLRFTVRPVRRRKAGSRLEWSDAPPAVPGLGLRPISAVLADSLVRRSIQVGQREAAEQTSGSPDGEMLGSQTAFRWRLAAPPNDVISLLAGQIDEPRLADLLSALMLLDWAPLPDANWSEETRDPPDPAWALLAPFFHGRPIGWGTDRVELKPESTWPRQLTSGRLEAVMAAALRRLGIARLQPASSDGGALARSTTSGPRLAAALLVPISTASAARLLRSTVPRPLE